ncbi:Ribosomal RNA small subunit methyltransferase B [Neolewinella maritima]|uniref:Ribosomal RNA small subunit methyltransferase B n=1 Tax=Neolewinella maritima TaxID=1383882 RepID=A0ABM9AYA9_9BACT|nr:RsmB/NOP family class I SAM-dependent RNA methyltransferase [Neolewinella maritima]CAH0999710.1 Ribosomal RNA small subunit methyltransferase B [Neolewinella maritima]
MKFYPAQVDAIAEALQNIFQNGTYADREIARILKADKRRGSKDRAFIAEHTYGVVRYYRLYAHLAGGEPREKSDYWRLVGVHLLLQGHVLPNWREFAGLNMADLQEDLGAARAERVLRESIPDWLDELGEQQLGADWAPTLTALNEQAPVVLRANRLKASPTEVQTALAADGIVTELLDADALRVTERKNLFRTQAFRDGLFELQDFSSQQAAPALEAEPGQLVIDACAGAGGKTLHLAALMENKGRLLSLDIHGWKLDELKRRARRAGVTNMEPRPITSTKITKRLTGKADRVLLDVPCSGLGVLRRNPDAKWKLYPDVIDRVVAEQADILSRYSRMVKPGGKLVYATCSVLPRENEQQVAQFLASDAGRGWTLEYSQSYLPQRDGYDGFFVSRMSLTE